MRVLVFDFETTGLVNFKLAADHPDQPDIVEIAAVTMTGPDTVTEELENSDHSRTAGRFLPRLTASRSRHHR